MSAAPTSTPAGAATGASSFIDPQTLMRIKSLHLRAKIVVQGFMSGLHRSPYHGFSVEFSEYRQYTPGDDPKYLDWRLFARTDRYYIKRFEEETNLRCHLLVDLSRSMGFGSLSYNKVEYARTAARSRLRCAASTAAAARAGRSYADGDGYAQRDPRRSAASGRCQLQCRPGGAGHALRAVRAGRLRRQLLQRLGRGPDLHRGGQAGQRYHRPRPRSRRLEHGLAADRR